MARKKIRGKTGQIEVAMACVKIKTDKAQMTSKRRHGEIKDVEYGQNIRKKWREQQKGVDKNNSNKKATKIAKIRLNK